MPTYVYRCRECDETLEVFQSFSDKPLKKHEQCGGELRKVFHASGVVFKGSGYYVTDSRPSQSGAPANSKPSDGTSEGSSEKTTDSSDKSGGDGKLKKQDAPSKKPKTDKVAAEPSSTRSAAASD